MIRIVIGKWQRSLVVLLTAVVSAGGVAACSEALSGAGGEGAESEQVEGAASDANATTPDAESFGTSHGAAEDQQVDGLVNLTAQQLNALDACEAETGTRSFEDCPVKVLCSTLTPDDSVKLTVDFEPQTNACEWVAGKDAHVDDDDRSNLKKRNRYTQARVEQVKDIEPLLTVPGGQKAIFCSVDIAVTPTDPGGKLRYDDDLMLVFGGYDADSGVEGGALLITRHTQIPDALMAPVPEFTDVTWPLYLWTDRPRHGNDKALVGLPLSNSGGGFQLFCLGQGKSATSTETCSIPVTDKFGDFAISLPNETAQALGIRAALNGNYNLSVVVTGDDDARPDCQHNGFEAELDVGYILLPEVEVQTLASGGGLI